MSDKYRNHNNMIMSCQCKDCRCADLQKDIDLANKDLKRFEKAIDRMGKGSNHGFSKKANTIIKKIAERLNDRRT